MEKEINDLILYCLLNLNTGTYNLDIITSLNLGEEIVN